MDGEATAFPEVAKIAKIAKIAKHPMRPSSTKRTQELKEILGFVERDQSNHFQGDEGDQHSRRSPH